MTIDFQFTPDDYRDAFKTHYRKGASVFTRWTLRLLVVVGVIFLLMGILLFATGQRAINIWLVPSLIGAFWIWVGMGGSYQRSAKKQFAKNPTLREPRRIEFTNDGVKTDAGIASSQMSWKAYLRFVESKDAFLLYSSPACFNIVPKRVLQPAQVDELRALLQRKIGKEAAVAAS
jgi:YcxB-like protein